MRSSWFSISLVSRSSSSPLLPWSWEVRSVIWRWTNFMLKMAVLTVWEVVVRTARVSIVMRTPEKMVMIEEVDLGLRPKMLTLFLPTLIPTRSPM